MIEKLSCIVTEHRFACLMKKPLLSPALPRKSLNTKDLTAILPRPAGANSGRRTGERISEPEKSMLSRAQMKKAFLEMSRMYGRRAKGVKKTMSKAAIEQRRAAGKASAKARGFTK